MVRNYKRKVGSRKYGDYKLENLEEALEAITSKRMSIKGASKHFKISYGTLHNKISNKHMASIGRPQAFTNLEEDSFVGHLKAISDHGFPISREDLRIIVKDYLDKKGIQHKCFKNNYPGYDWVNSFMRRHKDSIRLRKAANINSRRYEITKEEMQEYMNNLKVSLDGILPRNIVNYDETAMSDDPGRKQLIFQKNKKYAEVNVNTTKTNISVMFAASASGELLPPYIIYKAKNIYQSWTEEGPEFARYSCSVNGWFDGISFLNWFKKIILPYRKKLLGKFAIIGDNLSSHISEEIIKLAHENDITLVYLPPNSTHISQPLDVSVFRGLKSKWREILGIWKKDNPKKLSLEKSAFPNLLKLTLDGIGNMRQNVLSGFKSTGICPIDENAILKRFNDKEVFSPEIVSQTFIEHLAQKTDTIVPKKKRGKKFNVAPGTSVGLDAIRINQDNPDQNTSDTSDMEQELDENEIILQAKNIKENGHDNTRLVLVSQEILEANSQEMENMEIEESSIEVSVGSYIIVMFSTERNRSLHYVGLVEKKGKSTSVHIRFFRKTSLENGKISYFSEPNVADISEIEISQVVAKLPEPKIVRGRLMFDFCFDQFENIV